MSCRCSSCLPTDAPNQCAVCGQEVRLGVREGQRGWLHRENVDHYVVFGHRLEPDHLAEVLTARARVLAESGKDDVAEKDADEDEWAGDEIPAPEITHHPIEISDLPPRSGMRQIATLIDKSGVWELRRLTHARGPYVGARGQVLSISDSIVIGAIGDPQLDGAYKIAVGSWRDGKFDFGYTGIVKNGVASPTKVNATDLKTFIKGAPA